MEERIEDYFGDNPEFSINFINILSFVKETEIVNTSVIFFFYFYIRLWA